MKWPSFEFGRLCCPTEQRDPTQTPDKPFVYIDIASIDRRSKRITATQTLLGDEAPSRARKAVQAGDVLVSTVRPNLNAVALVPDELDGEIASTGFCVLRADRELSEPAWLFYRTQTPIFIEGLVGQMRGASYPAVSDGVVRASKIPLPPLSEQRRIVELLEQADALRRRRADADSRGARTLPALFRKMFGDPVRNPKQWPLKRFDALGEARLGKMLDGNRQTGFHRRKYLRNLNLQWNRFELDNLLEMDFFPEEREEFKLIRGDLLICEGGEVGRAAIWDEQLKECYFQKALHRVRPYKGKATSEFLLYWLWDMAKQQALVSLNSKATIAHLTGVQLAALKTIAPPYPMMEQFTALVRISKTNSNKQKTSQDKIETLFQTLLHRAFIGNLTAGWREAHMKELLAEMEIQSRILKGNLQP